MNEAPEGMLAPAAARAPLRADLILVAVTAVWGLTFVVVKDALDAADPFSFLAVRFAVAGAAAAAIARRQLLHPGVIRHGAILGVFLFIGYAFQTVGLQFTSEARSAFITGLAVILVPIASLALFRRVPQVPSLVGVAIAFVGLHVLTGGLTDPAADRETWSGDLLTLGCAAAFALHIALTEKYARGAPPMALVSVQLWVVALLAALALPFVEVRLVWSPQLIGAVLFTALVASTACIGLQTWAQARTTAVRAALIFSMEPVFAAATSVALGREELDARELAGGGLTILAVVVAEAGNAWWARRA